MKKIEAVIFDMDGVLLDVRASIRQVNLRSVPAYLRKCAPWLSTDE